jgi:hypothetical protein
MYAGRIGVDVFALLACTHALAGEIPDDALAFLRLEPVSAPALPDGIRVAWESSGPRLAVVVSNDAADPLLVDWGHSAWTDGGGRVSAVLPAAAQHHELFQLLGSSTVPPGTTISVLLARLPLDREVETPQEVATAVDAGHRVALTLALQRPGSAEIFWTQPFDANLDAEATEHAAAARAERDREMAARTEEQRARVSAEARRSAAALRSHALRVRAIEFAVGGAAAGLAAGSGAWADDPLVDLGNPTSSALLGAMFFGAGGVLAVQSLHQAARIEAAER